MERSPPPGDRTQGQILEPLPIIFFFILRISEDILLDKLLLFRPPFPEIYNRNEKVEPLSWDMDHIFRNSPADFIFGEFSGIGHFDE